jgi:hypothetical protein
VPFREAPVLELEIMILEEGKMVLGREGMDGRSVAWMTRWMRRTCHERDTGSKKNQSSQTGTRGRGRVVAHLS